MTDQDEGAARPSSVRPSLFLERQSYRRRRLADAARLLPFLGAAVFALPLLWPDTGEEAMPMSSAVLYVFVCWGALILVSLVFGFAARRLAARDTPEPENGPWRH